MVEDPNEMLLKMRKPDQVLMQISREIWLRLDKQRTGVPVAFFVDEVDRSLIHLWPQPTGWVWLNIDMKKPFR